MLTDYIAAAMRQAEYKVLEDDTYWGEIPPLRGVWANADSLKECEKELESVLEDWILISLNFGDAIPEIDGMRVSAKSVDVPIEL